MGFEPTASSMRPKRSSQLSYTPVTGHVRIVILPEDLAIHIQEDLVEPGDRYRRCVRVRSFRHPYLWGRDHPVVVDTLIAIALALFGVVSEITTEPPDDIPFRPHDGLSIAMTVAAAVPLLVRRKYPMASLAAIIPLSIWYSHQQYIGGGPFIALLFALYAVAARPSSRKASVGALITVSILGTALVVKDGVDIGPDDLLPLYGFIVTAWVLGDNMRIRRAHVAAVEDRAERLEREQFVEAQRAVLQERSRIARELHDIVAHSMSVMLIQAGAARRQLDRDVQASAEALGHIELTGRHAMEEMRRLIGVLREDGDTASRLPQPGIDDVAILIEHCREAGLDVDLRVEGDEREMPSGLELVVYRIVQEALTNTMKHAGPARADVVFDYGTDVFRLVVADDGRGAASTPVSQPGHGLAGMRERVSLYGGELVAGPQPGGGFRVTATLPLATATAKAAPLPTTGPAATTSHGPRTNPAATTKPATAHG
jgi:signal transduction histidine kinase